MTLLPFLLSVLLRLANLCIRVVEMLLNGVLLYVAPQLHSQSQRLSSLRLAGVGVFPSWKSTDATAPEGRWVGQPVVKHLPAHC